MKQVKRLVFVLCLFLVLTALATVLSGCANSSEIDTTGMYQIIYDGNGGVLGNKTSTMRKLLCYPGSKIPDYPVDYTPNQYTVPSLGIAMRKGYNLVGWYTSADYTASESGSYLKLDKADGYGVYEAQSDGEYVYKPIADENGPLVYIYLEPSRAAAEAEPDTYVLLTPAFDEENNPLLTVAPGFYVCNGDGDIAAIDDEAMRRIYSDAYATHIYTAEEAEALGGYQLFDDLTDAQQLLFEGFPRYQYCYQLAGEADAGLDRFALVSGYAPLFDLFEEDDAGDYVEANGNYVKATDADVGLQHYAVAKRFVFTGDATTEMTRYEIVAQYWNFAEDHVTEDRCVWDGEKFVLHLYAHWEKKLTVLYHYENGTGQVDESTTKLLDDNRTSVSLRSGATIGRKEIVPTYLGHTFVAWSKSADEYDPWDFEKDVFPEGTTSMDLYAYYVEGTYTRVVSASGLAAIGKDPAGKYLIVNDLNLGGKDSPFGLTSGKAFTGEILSFGKTISNFNLKLTPVSEQQNDASIVVIAAPIPVAEGAKISGLNLVGTVTCYKAGKTLPTATNKNYSLIASGLIGKEAGSTSSTIENCTVDLTFVPESSTAFEKTNGITYHYTFADFVATGDAVISSSASTLTCDGFPTSGSVQTTLRKLALDQES